MLYDWSASDTSPLIIGSRLASLPGRLLYVSVEEALPQYVEILLIFVTVTTVEAAKREKRAFSVYSGRAVSLWLPRFFESSSAMLKCCASAA